jgi:hypothetical protein
MAVLRKKRNADGLIAPFSKKTPEHFFPEKQATNVPQFPVPHPGFHRQNLLPAVHN